MRDYARLYAALEYDLRQTVDTTEPPYCASSEVEAAKSALLRGLFKKLAPKGETTEVIERTISKFVAHNNTVSFIPPHIGDSDSDCYLLSLFRDGLWQLLDLDGDATGCDFNYLKEHYRAGPGASVKADSRNWYSKFWDSDHSYTDPFILALFRAAVVESETMTDAYLHWSKSFSPRLVEGNVLFTVPKNAEISRTCCTEPFLNSLFQQGVGSFIEERLQQRWNIYLDRQPDFNRKLCHKGSLTGAYGTIDLSMASDSISLDLCRWAIPPSVLKWLMLFRSRTTILPDGSKVELKMVSTMGNGFTFPLETAIFASAVRAVYQAKGISLSFGRDSSNAAVFGDDIVVRKDCYDAVVRLLQRLGFTVNEGKSFNSGHFRESCGFDYWLGYQVRPVYIESLETVQDVYSAFNRLSRWSAAHMVPLGRTLFTLLEWAPFIGVPFSEADDSGFKVPSSYAPVARSVDGQFKYVVLEAVSTAQAVPNDRKSALKAGYRDHNPWGWELTFVGGFARTRDSTFLGYREIYLNLKSLGATPETLSTFRIDAGWKTDIHRRPFQGEVLKRRRRTKTIPYWDWFGVQDDRVKPAILPAWQRGVEALLTSVK